jgi:tRNA dimethylallyltransferase
MGTGWGTDTRMSESPPTPQLTVVFVAGPTASGKTALALALAHRFAGEIVNADSRAFYRGMDIGTAKPTAAERAAAPHHLIDVANPDEVCSLGWFLERARTALAEIARGGRLPLVVGGTGQYVRALSEGWDPPHVPPDPKFRALLERRIDAEGLPVLAAELRRLDPSAATRIDMKNPRRVVRALEVALNPSGRRTSPRPAPRPRSLILGIAVEREELYRRIDARVDAMFEAGLVEEVRGLLARGYDCALPAFSAIGYREVCGHLSGDLTLEEARSRTKLNTHRLARTQAAWFRRSDPRITWLDAGPGLTDAAIDAVRLFLETAPPAAE